MNPRLARTILGELDVAVRLASDARQWDLLTPVGRVGFARALEALDQQVGYLQHLVSQKTEPEPAA